MNLQVYMCLGGGVKGRAADATDAPQHWGVPCNPVMKMICFLFFRVMEHRWNEIYRGKPKYSGKTLSQCHFVHHKSHMDWPGIEPGPPRWEAGDWLPEPLHGQVYILLNVYLMKAKSNVFLPLLLYYNLTSIRDNYTTGRKRATVLTPCVRFRNCLNWS
jgi:hypothetical protein